MIHREFIDENENLCRKVEGMLREAGYELAQVDATPSGNRFVTPGYECHASTQSAHTVMVSYVTLSRVGWKLTKPATEVRPVLEPSFQIEETQMGWRLRERRPS